MLNSKKTKLFKLILLCFILVSVFSTFTYGANFELPEPSNEFYVYDEANVINDSTKKHIININKELYKKTNAQIVVASVNSLEDRPKEDYGLELFRKWEIGGSKENNGLLFLVAPNEREVTIQIGYGLEGAITDGRAGEILDTYAVPYFAEDNYDEGILNSFNAIVENVTREYEVTIEGIEVEEPPQTNATRINLPMILLIIGLLAVDFIFFGGTFSFFILRALFSGRGRGGGGGFGGGSSGGGGSAGGGGAGRSF